MIYYIYILALTFIALNKIPKELFTYKLCNTKKISGIHQNIIKKHNIKRVDNNNDNWDLFIPCGYKFVEKEISSLKLNPSNKFIFGISGSDNIASKNNLWDILRNYYGFTIASQIMPVTYILSKPSDMLQFHKSYSNDKTYILKKNLQRKTGLCLVKNDINKISNAKKDDYKVIQYYLTDPFLVNGYKLNIRLYLFIKCNKDKKLIYMHKSGKCLYTVQKYKNDLNFDTNITSYKPSPNIYDINPLTLPDLYSYIDKNGHNSTIVKNRIKSSMIKLATAIKNSVCNKSSLSEVTTFQLFGVDVILDNNLIPKILEINKGPNMHPVNKIDSELKHQVYEDIYSSINFTESKINNYELLV